MAEKSNWVTFSMMEVPFWRDGMQPEEYEKEREYYYRNFDKVKSGEYVPLWKQ